MEVGGDEKGQAAGEDEGHQAHGFFGPEAIDDGGGQEEPRGDVEEAGLDLHRKSLSGEVSATGSVWCRTVLWWSREGRRGCRSSGRWSLVRRGPRQRCRGRRSWSSFFRGWSCSGRSGPG